MQALAGELGPDVRPHHALADASGLAWVDPVGFLRMSEYVRTHRARLGQQVSKLAIVRPPGAIGATVAGFFVVLDPPYPVRVFTDRGEALRWLGEDPGLQSALDAAVAAETHEAALLSGVRRVMRATLETATLPAVARALALSSRTLQRRLRAAGTTFQRVLTEERLGEAERLLVETDAPITAIALEVGFASTSRFAVAFRHRSGLRPSEWRRQHRSDGAVHLKPGARRPGAEVRAPSRAGTPSTPG